MSVKNIKKTAIGFSIAVLLTLGILSFSFADGENSNVLSAITALGKALNPLFSDGSDDTEIAGLILGEEIGVRELRIRAVSYEFNGAEDPLSTAWDSYKVTIYEKKFAEEHGLIPTDEEIWDFTQQMKEQVYGAPDGGMGADIFLETIGIDKDEYWNDYKLKYETPSQLIDANIARYVTENDLEWPTGDEIIASCTDEITNAPLIEEWENR